VPKSSRPRWPQERWSSIFVPIANRAAEGEIPGAIVLERNVLEWRLDPTSPDAIPQAGRDRQVIIVCNEGYASSLAANTLRELGLTRVGDLDGGYRAWRERQRAKEAPGPV
jgi:rhodanese-related sulfurtransferase